MEHRLASPPLSPLCCFTTPLPQLLMSYTRAGKALLAWQCKPQTEMKFAEIQTVSRQLLNSPQDIANDGFGGDYSSYCCNCGTMSVWCHLQNICVKYFLEDYSIQRSAEPNRYHKAIVTWVLCWNISWKCSDLFTMLGIPFQNVISTQCYYKHWFGLHSYYSASVIGGMPSCTISTKHWHKLQLSNLLLNMILSVWFNRRKKHAKMSLRERLHFMRN